MDSSLYQYMGRKQGAYFLATFDFPAGKQFEFWKYHKNTLCKILDGLQKPIF